MDGTRAEADGILRAGNHFESLLKSLRISGSPRG
jgi:hypothetical protein